MWPNRVPSYQIHKKVNSYWNVDRKVDDKPAWSIVGRHHHIWIAKVQRNIYMKYILGLYIVYII